MSADFILDITYFLLRIAYCEAGSTTGIPDLGNTHCALRNKAEELR